MKKTMTIIASIVVFAAGCNLQGDEWTKGAGGPPGCSSEYRIEHATVLKVFSGEDGKSQFRAYQVKWKQQDVIVSDPLSGTDFKEGNKITFMVMKTEVPYGERKLKLLAFTINDAPFSQQRNTDPR